MSLCILLFAGLARPSLAAPAASRPKIDDSDLAVLLGTTHPLVRPDHEVGRPAPDLLMEWMSLTLALRDGESAHLDGLLAAQQDAMSPDYHRWLTPEEFGVRFGLRDSDLRLVLDWLQGRGFRIDEVARGRGWVHFTGSVRQVEEAFATEIHDYKIGGRLRHANATDLSVPRGLLSLVTDVPSLHIFPTRVHSVAAPPASVTPNDGRPGFQILGPADFAIVYDVNPAYNAGIDGTGQSVAIVAASDMLLSDVRKFRSFYGLPPNDPVFINVGPDPGVTSAEGEADLDVDWVGAVAPRVTVELVISNQAPLASAQYIVDQNLAPVLSMSFAACNTGQLQHQTGPWPALWAQAGGCPSGC